MTEQRSLLACYAAFVAGFTYGSEQPYVNKIFQNRLAGSLVSTDPSLVFEITNYDVAPPLYHFRGAELRKRLFRCAQECDHNVPHLRPSVRFPLFLREICPWLPPTYDAMWVPILEDSRGRTSPSLIVDDAVVDTLNYKITWDSDTVTYSFSGISSDFHELGTVLCANLVPAGLVLIHDALARLDDADEMLPIDLEGSDYDSPFSHINTNCSGQNFHEFLALPFLPSDSRSKKVNWMADLINKCQSLGYAPTLETVCECPLQLVADNYTVAWIYQAIKKGWNEEPEDPIVNGPLGYFPEAIMQWLAFFYKVSYSPALATRFIADHDDFYPSKYVSICGDAWYGSSIYRPWWRKYMFLSTYFCDENVAQRMCGYSKANCQSFDEVYSRYLIYMHFLHPGKEVVTSEDALKIYAYGNRDSDVVFELLMGTVNVHTNIIVSNNIRKSLSYAILNSERQSLDSTDC